MLVDKEGKAVCWSNQHERFLHYSGIGNLTVSETNTVEMNINVLTSDSVRHGTKLEVT